MKILLVILTLFMAGCMQSVGEKTSGMNVCEEMVAGIHKCLLPDGMTCYVYRDYKRGGISCIGENK